MDLPLRWQRLCDRLSIPNAVGLFDAEIVPRYGEAHRAYHNLTHIDNCLTLLFAFGESTMRDTGSWLGAEAATQQEIDTLELALWFHDIVYDPARSDNEAKSAELLKGLLAPLGLYRQVIDDASDLVLLTKTHDTRSLKGRGRLVMLDIDLSILGEVPHAYWEYEHGIRREYSFVPLDVYVKERVKVLQAFQERERHDRLFRTPLFHAQFNNFARQNLAHAIAYLQTMPVDG